MRKMVAEGLDAYCNYAISQCNLNHWRACLLFVRWICQIANCQSRQAPLENWLRLSNLGRI